MHIENEGKQTFMPKINISLSKDILDEIKITDQTKVIDVPSQPMWKCLRHEERGKERPGRSLMPSKSRMRSEMLWVRLI